MIPNRSDYPYQVDCNPDFSFLTIQIPANKSLKVEASAMAAMDTHLKMKTRMKGGLNRLLTGESLFINEFTAENGPGEIAIAPGSPGDLAHVYLEPNEVIFLQNSGYVASGMDVKIESKWQGFIKGFFSGESLFLIRCTGPGDLWFSTFGALFELEVAKEYIIDTGHIVAFTGGLDYEVSRFGGYKSLFFSGEGFVCRFHGEGKVWIQTRKIPAFAGWINSYRRRSNN